MTHSDERRFGRDRFGRERYAEVCGLGFRSHSLDYPPAFSHKLLVRKCSDLDKSTRIVDQE